MASPSRHAGPTAGARSARTSCESLVEHGRSRWSTGSHASAVCCRPWKPCGTTCTPGRMRCRPSAMMRSARPPARDEAHAVDGGSGGLAIGGLAVGVAAMTVSCSGSCRRRARWPATAGRLRLASAQARELPRHHGPARCRNRARGMPSWRRPRCRSAPVPLKVVPFSSWSFSTDALTFQPHGLHGQCLAQRITTSSSALKLVQSD